MKKMHIVKLRVPRHQRVRQDPMYGLEAVQRLAKIDSQNQKRIAVEDKTVKFKNSFI